MKKKHLLALALLATPGAFAASRLDFSVWMRAIDNKSVSVQQHLRAGRLEPATADALELERLYGLMATYFERDYPAADAVQVSRDGQQQAAAVAQHLASQNVEAAALSARALALACNECHDTYKPFP